MKSIENKNEQLELFIQKHIVANRSRLKKGVMKNG
jgi:hypothetical protein